LFVDRYPNIGTDSGTDRCPNIGTNISAQLEPDIEPDIGTYRGTNPRYEVHHPHHQL